MPNNNNDHRALVALQPPDPEVLAQPVRRRFSAAYKLRILREIEACNQPGQMGALLRREGLYSSLLSSWRRQREARGLAGLAPRPRGRRPDPSAKRIAELERAMTRLQHKLTQAEALIDLQKKVSALLGMTLASQNEGNDSWLPFSRAPRGLA